MNIVVEVQENEAWVFERRASSLAEAEQTVETYKEAGVVARFVAKGGEPGFSFKITGRPD
jgi:hypothetical protein